MFTCFGLSWWFLLIIGVTNVSADTVVTLGTEDYCVRQSVDGTKFVNDQLTPCANCQSACPTTPLGMICTTTSSFCFVTFFLPHRLQACQHECIWLCSYPDVGCKRFRCLHIGNCSYTTEHAPVSRLLFGPVHFRCQNHHMQQQ